MHDPTAYPRLSVVALAAMTLGLSGCDRQTKNDQPAPAVVPTPPPTVPTPAAPAALSRAELLTAMDAAAATYAAGDVASAKAAEADPLVGRRFTVRQAFGCTGPLPPGEEPPEGLPHWTWRADKQSIELQLAPGDWTGAALVSGAAANWEAVEGLWLTRPWLQSDECPGVSPDPLASGPAAPSPQTMGLAAVFEAEGSRLEQRNGRAYSFIVRGKAGQPPAVPTGGYRLVVEGRLVAFADGRAVHCRAASPDQRPVCIAAARLDRVAFEDADGAVLSEWRTG